MLPLLGWGEPGAGGGCQMVVLFLLGLIILHLITQGSKLCAKTRLDVSNFSDTFLEFRFPHQVFKYVKSIPENGKGPNGSYLGHDFQIYHHPPPRPAFAGGLGIK